MAKKSGGGLDPGADPTIVAAAYRAGMGHVPGDYSKTFQGIATGYSKAMEKMGAGLAKAAEVGASIAAPLIEQSIQNYKTMTSEASSISADDYGQSFIDSIYGVNGEGGWLNELKEEKLAWKKGINEDGSTMTTAQKKEAKRKWKQKRDKGFAHIRQLQKGEFLNTSLIAEGDFNPEATGSENALLHSAIQMKGKPLPEGHPYAGVSVKSIIGEDGGISLELTKDGKSISGLNDDGTLEYHSEEGVVTTSYEFTGEGAEYRALGGKLSVSDANPISALNFYSNSKNTRKKSDYKKIQESLNKIGITDSDGNVLDVDGEWGPKSRSAYDKYLAQKDDLETAWLDENLTEEEKKKYQKTTTTPSTTKPLTVTADNIEKLIVPKDYKMRENLTAIDLNELKNGKNGFDFRENDIRRQIGEQIKTSAQLKDAMHAPLANMDGTYADYLGQPNEWTQEMYSVLENMSGIQDIGEPGIDADDFVGEQGAANMAVLRKEMLNANNPASKKMFVDWYTEGIRKTHAVEKAKYDKKLRNKTEGTKTTSAFSFDSGTNPYTGGSQVSGQDRNIKRARILGKENFQGQMASWEFDGKTGKYKGSNWYENFTGDKDKEYTIYEVLDFENVVKDNEDSKKHNMQIGDVHQNAKGEDYVYNGEEMEKLTDKDKKDYLLKMVQSIGKLNSVNKIVFSGAIKAYDEGKLTFIELTIVNKWFKGEISMEEMEEQVPKLK